MVPENAELRNGARKRWKGMVPARKRWNIRNGPGKRWNKEWSTHRKTMWNKEEKAGASRIRDKPRRKLTPLSNKMLNGARCRGFRKRRSPSWHEGVPRPSSFECTIGKLVRRSHGAGENLASSSNKPPRLRLEDKQDGETPLPVDTYIDRDPSIV